MYIHIIESMTELKVMQQIWAETALTPRGWQRDVLVSVDDSGVITSVEADTKLQGTRAGILLPAPVNLHSHAFQRAMAGLTERRGEDPSDSFWTWRKLMYRFLDHLSTGSRGGHHRLRADGDAGGGIRGGGRIPLPPPPARRFAV